MLENLTRTTRLRRTMADGSLLDLEAAGFDLDGLWLSTVKIQRGRIDGRRPDAAFQQDYAIAPAGNADGVIQFVLDATVEQRLEAQGGEFLVARSRHEDGQGVVLWRGPWHEISTFTLPGERAVDALAMFDGLRFTDSKEGLVVHSTADSDAQVHVHEFSLTVPDVGEVDVLPAARALAAVPRWSGAKVHAGEVWQVDVTQTEDATSHHALRLASPTAVVSVTPRDTADPVQANALQFIQSLRSVSWESRKGS